MDNAVRAGRTSPRAKRTDVQYLFRMPWGLRQRIEKKAATNGRSMNTEIIEAIEKHLENGDKLEQMEKRLAALELRMGV